MTAYVSAQTLTVTSTQTNASVCTAPCNGTATANVTGGSPPYTYLWGTNPNQNTQTATGLCPGTYSVGVADGSFNYGGTTVTITCVQGVNEYHLNSFVDVFPNPASDNISITFTFPNGGKVTALSVYNSIGEKVLFENYSSQKFSGSLFVGNLPEGTYFLELKDEKHLYRTKFIKE